MKRNYYNVNIDWDKERKGTLSSHELCDKIEVGTPPEFPKETYCIWSPEHLFIAAINSCYMDTFLAVAENSGLLFSNYSCSAKGKTEKVDEKYELAEVELKPILIITNPADKEKAEKILQKALNACFISNSIKSKVSLIVKIKYQKTSEKFTRRKIRSQKEEKR